MQDEGSRKVGLFFRFNFLSFSPRLPRAGARGMAVSGRVAARARCGEAGENLNWVATKARQALMVASWRLLGCLYLYGPTERDES
jgi:hypothetical protein